MVGSAFIFDSICAAAGFAYYTAANLWESLRDENVGGRSERWGKKNPNRRPKPQPRTLLFFIQLAGNLIIFAESLTYAISLARSRHDRLAMRSDPDVSAVLFGSLLWLVFFLGLTDASNAAGHEQMVPWMICSISYAVSCAINTTQQRESVGNIFVQWARFVCVLGLILSSVISRHRARAVTGVGEGTADETEPLIASESTIVVDTPKDDDEIDDDDDDSDDKSVKSYASEEDEQEEQKEDENDAKKEEKKQRKALRDRPWYEYISSFGIFIPYIRPRSRRQYFYLSVMILNTIAARGITIGQPLMLGAVIDDLTRQRFVLWRILAYVALRFASSSSGTSLIRNLASYRLNIELHNALLTRCFNHIMDLDAQYHMSKNTPATWQIMERGQSVINLLQSICFDHLPVVADLIIALFVVSHLFGAYICFAVALTMVLLSWSNRITMSKKTSMRRYFVDLWRNWYSHMTESLQFWRTVSEFNKIEHEKIRHWDKTAAYTSVSLKQQSFRNYLAALQEIVVTMGFTFVCIIAAMEIASGRLDVGRFVVLISYWGQVMSPVTRIAGFASDIAEQLVDAEKLMLLLEKKPKVTNKPNAPPFQFKGGHVKFEKCDFSYDGTRVVTKNVSFEAKPGQTVALVGETGGGKSTIFNLLYRFYDPSSGRVIVDDQDISQVELHSYRSYLGLVPQDTILFNTSIVKNIRYGNLNATKAEVIEACKAAQFHEKIMKFPKKYKQKVGELAQKLSGGEKQRLAIARAILKKPGILLLDEATSAVDSVTESKIQDSLEKLSEGRTTFVIAHRLSTIINADTILVVKNGEIVEAGSHQDLLDRGNGAYKELWEAQLKLAGGKPKESKAESSGQSTPATRPNLLEDDNSVVSREGGQEGVPKVQTTPTKAASQTDASEGKSQLVGQTERCEETSSLATPPLGQDVTPRHGNLDDEVKAEGEHESGQKDSENDTKSASIQKSSRCGDRDYGTL